MRDYAELITRLKQSDDNCNAECCECSGECLSSGCNIFSEAADAIEELLATVRSVVHCKDCKWCHAGYCEKYDDIIPWGCANKPWEDWFCADGKRREMTKEAQDAD